MKQRIITPRKLLMAAPLALALSVMPISEAEANPLSCSAVLCLGGTTTVHAGHLNFLQHGHIGYVPALTAEYMACKPGVVAYFSIIATKHGSFSCSRTRKARRKFLDKCGTVSHPDAPRSHVTPEKNAIDAKYGCMKNIPGGWF